MGPNVLSELVYEDVETMTATLKGRYPLFSHLVLDAVGEIGVLLDGEIGDWDYFGPDRTELFSYATAQVDGDSRTRLEASVGWEFRFDFAVPTLEASEPGSRRAIASEISIVPSLGYGYSSTEIQMKDGTQIFPDLGPIEGLNSSFDPQLEGMLVGLDVRARLAKRLLLRAEIDYGPWMNYSADAVWNLRPEFDGSRSFSHTADAEQQRIEVGLQWLMGQKMNRSISLTYFNERFETDAGLDQVFLISGDTLQTRLNGANWKSQGWRLGLRFGR
jgi:hypothetical protein